MVLVRQEDQTIRTEWYSKPMSSGRFLDYFSCHPLHMKMNMITNFIRRVTEFSTNLSRSEIESIIDQHLKINHYPTSLRHRLVNRANGRTLAVDESTRASSVEYRPMPFVNGLSQRIKKSLSVDFPNITIATRNENTVNRLFTNTKDRIPNEMKTNVIYRIPCADCQASYVGLTTQHLKTRLSKHRSQRKQLDELRSSPNCYSPTVQYEVQRMKEYTAVLKHTIEEQHSFELGNTQVLDQHRRSAALDVLEMCHIINTDHTVNKRSDVDGISSTYAGILHTVKKMCRSRQSSQTHAPNLSFQ
ncbi:uncharacterized protein LOC119766716 [Culex quinquefasciatus]|uniref:uncharacterized protein LOC119766716 n=1 Tax=Culex quinquefasciatus TaxID=7176 RepID=UPI0018E30388|nr:uncharacterized protein LOC119766716 [Culex quinquefasciatus]